jgi:hypothetical protein
MKKTSRIFKLLFFSSIFISSIYYIQSFYKAKLFDKTSVKIENQILKRKNFESKIKEDVHLSSCRNKTKQKYKKSIWTFLTEGDGYYKSAIKLIKSIKNQIKFKLQT